MVRTQSIQIIKFFLSDCWSVRKILWWARLGSNQGPTPYEGAALPLSYGPVINQLLLYITDLAKDKLLPFLRVGQFGFFLGIFLAVSLSRG